MKKKTYTFDINEETYNIKIKKTLIIDQIPHQQPSLMGRVTYTSSHALDELLHFDFTIETIPGQEADTIDLVPCFDPSVIHVPPIITETIKMCIKNYYKITIMNFVLCTQKQFENCFFIYIKINEE